MSNTSADLAYAITAATDYFRQHMDYTPPEDSIKAREKSYDTIRRDYEKSIKQALTDYATADSGTRSTSYASAFKRAAVESFQVAFEKGYSDTSGDTTINSNAQDWLSGSVNEELGNIASTFATLKDLRDSFFADEATAADLRDFVLARVDGYTSTLDSVYNSGAMWGNKNQMLTWRLGNTETHCDTCKSLDGNAHKAKWYISKNYIPRKPGADMDCGGYRCDCYLTNPKGDKVSI